MAFLGSLSKLEERVPAPMDFTKDSVVKQFRRLLFEDFGFIEAARRQSGLYEGAYLNVDDFSTKNSFKDLMLENPHAIVNFAGFTNRPQIRGDDIEDLSSASESEADVMIEEKKGRYGQDVRMKRFSNRMSIWPPFSLWAHWVLASALFEWIMIIVIVFSSLLMCIEGELPDNSELRLVTSLLEFADFLFLLMFAMEIILKWLDSFADFWKDSWNVFDFIVTAASLLTPAFDMAFPESNEDETLETMVNIIKYIRIARILRTLNVVTRLNKIMMIWRAILRTFGPLLSITVLMLYFFYIFSIIGIELCDRFTKTHKNNLRYVDRFTSLPYASLTLFQIFTIDHWHPILRELMDVMPGEAACIYILTWLLLGTFIFKNIFAGVMVNNFQNIREELVNETVEIEYKSRMAEGFNIMEIADLEEEILRGHQEKGWEMNVFHALDLINICDRNLSPSLWPRDTLFHYYVLLEAMAANLAERDQLLSFLNEALLQYYSA